MLKRHLQNVKLIQVKWNAPQISSVISNVWIFGYTENICKMEHIFIQICEIV